MTEDTLQRVNLLREMLRDENYPASMRVPRELVDAAEECLLDAGENFLYVGKQGGLMFKGVELHVSTER